ncbi:MAG TPA: hypothetical protein VFH47_07475 [Candidatus Thermoplasmatota archaeon]|nr:hypothetical protein [Candidatus Thermoplasmatota archaeon]
MEEARASIREAIELHLEDDPGPHAELVGIERVEVET